MQITDSAVRFGRISIAVHWLTAGLMFGLIGLGWYMEDLADGPVKFQVYGLHKSIGVAVLLLGLFRLAWRQSQPTPPPLGTPGKMVRGLRSAVHGLLLAAVLVLPLSGWMMSSGAGYPVPFFGLFELPALVPEGSALGEAAHATHGPLAWLLIAAVALHVAAAVKHHRVDGDATLRRMLGGS